MTRQDIQAAITDLQAFCDAGLSGVELAAVDRALGLFYEAYAQAVLTAHRIDVDLSRLCGFLNYPHGRPQQSPTGGGRRINELAA